MLKIYVSGMFEPRRTRRFLFFRLFPNVATAHDFRTFLSSRSGAAQDFLILFLSSGLRWRFFRDSNRGKQCHKCRGHFWSWEHFLQCPALALDGTLLQEFSTAAREGDWEGIVDRTRSTVIFWANLFRPEEICSNSDDVISLFS
jgi:hypothetical protein